MPEHEPTGPLTCDNCGKDISSGNGVVMFDRKPDGSKWNFAVCYDCSPATREQMERARAESEGQSRGPHVEVDMNSPDAKAFWRMLEQSE
jgi:hypothetical protein